MSIADRIEKQLNSILGNARVNVVDMSEQYRVHAEFPDGYVVDTETYGKAGRINVDLPEILASIKYSLGYERDLYILDGKYIVSLTIKDFKPTKVYKSIVEADHVLYRAGKKLIDLRTLETYEGEESIEKIYRRYGSEELVKRYLVDAYSYEWRYGVTMWYRNGLFEWIRGYTLLYKPVSKYVNKAVLVTYGGVYRTYSIDDVVAETALGKTDPKAVGEEFVKTFYKWLENSCKENVREQEKRSKQLFGIYQNYGELDINLKKLYIALKELGVSPPRILEALSRMGNDLMFARCSQDGVIRVDRGLVGEYDRIIRLLGEDGEFMKKEAVNIVLEARNIREDTDEYRVLSTYGVCRNNTCRTAGMNVFKALRRIKKDSLADLIRNEMVLVIDGYEIGDYDRMKWIQSFVKAYGVPESVEIIKIVGRNSEQYSGVIIKSKHGIALAI